MARSRTHWSRPAAMGVLGALARLGGSGTTYQIWRITRSLAVHSDVHSLRSMLREEHGYTVADSLEAVKRTGARAPDGGRLIVRYTLREDVRALHRRLRGQAALTPTLSRGEREPRQARQSLLFSTTRGGKRI